MKVKAHDGKLYAEVTLRDVVERSDVSDLPMLSEIKRLYDENAKLREELDAVGMAAYLYGKEQLESENAKLRKENDTLCHRIDELCREVESLRRTARRIVHCDGSVGHCACSACGGAIDQDDAWCRHCGTRLEDA